MAKVQEIGPYSAYAIAVKYGYKGTEEEWVKEQEANRKAVEAAAAAAEQSAKNAAVSASGAAQSGQQAVQNIQNAQTTALQAIDTAKQQAVQAAQAEAEKAATSAGQAASSAAEAAQSATNAAAEVGKVQSAGTSAVQAVRAAQNTATEAVSAAQQTATQAVSQAQTAAVSAVQAEGTKQTNAVASAASSALKGISDAKDAALSNVAEAGEAQVSAVGTAGTSAVEGVNDAKTAALKEIEDANAALPDPTQSDAGKVPTVKADGSAYELAGPYAPLSAAIRPTASGNPVSITDSVEWPLLGLKVYGKSTQDGTPSPENPVPIVSAGDDGEIGLQITGKNLLDQTKLTLVKNNIYYGSPSDDVQFNLIAGINYTLSVPDDVTLPNGIYFNNVENSNLAVAFDSRSVSFKPDKNIAVKLDVYWANGRPENATKLQLEVGPTATPYEPYKSQSLTISTPNGLPGIPVDSGGNYTDAEGQQWVCDEIDYAREVYVQSCAKENISGVPNFSETMDHPTRYFWSNALTNVYKDGTNVALSNFAKFNAWGASIINSFTLSGKNLFFKYGKPDAEDEVNALFSNLIENNQCYIIGQLESPIETPLSEEEIVAYRALHTYDGATVVSTAEDVAGLEVRYVADAQKYIDNKIQSALAPVNQAILEAKTNV